MTTTMEATTAVETAATMKTVATAPAMKADAAAPAEAPTPAIAAPVPAAAMPSVVIPAVMSPTPDIELGRRGNGGTGKKCGANRAQKKFTHEHSCLLFRSRFKRGQAGFVPL
jgi:hypothetical protein